MNELSYEIVYIVPVNVCTTQHFTRLKPHENLSLKITARFIYAVLKF